VLILGRRFTGKVRRTTTTTSHTADREGPVQVRWA
jgi:hypothetical protein